MSRKVWIETVLVVAIVAGLYIYLPAGSVGAETAVVIPAAAVDNPKAAGPLQTAVLAGGCFWGVQAVYQHVQGVREVLSGYSGGSKSTAEYEVVSSGSTGHAESVQIRFDPKEVSYGEILRIYFSVVHNPTELNRQGPDVGTQYRSNIFYSDETQKRRHGVHRAVGQGEVFGQKIVTRVDH
jgi:peptide-methionine (S)-S-oxide reductase